MPDDIHDNSKPVTLHGYKPRGSGSVKAPRWYYTPDNAMQFKPIFDKMIESMNDTEILSEVVGLKPSTLFAKANDALKWLQEVHTEHDKYALFRMRVSICRTDKGISIYYKKTIANLLQQATVTKNAVTWKEDFDKWFETATELDIFERDGVVVTEEQRRYVINLMSGLNSPTTEVEITSTRVKVMR